METVTWTVTEPTGEVKKVSGLEPIPYLGELKAAKDTAKEQKAFVDGWNVMRERLLLLGEMKSK